MRTRMEAALLVVGDDDLGTEFADKREILIEQFCSALWRPLESSFPRARLALAKVRFTRQPCAGSSASVGWKTGLD